MMLLLRRILRGGTRRTLGLSFLIAAVAVLALVSAQPARACWRTELIECFDRFPTQWPWATHPTSNPVRAWTTGTNVSPITWGINDRVFCTSAPGCNANAQSAWCMGKPDLGQDPDFDVYGANWNTWMIWGPVNLSIATAAQVSFWLYSRCGMGDSVYWGVLKDEPNFNTPTKVYVGGSRLMRTSDWEMQLMNLTNLRNSVGDSVSVLGFQTIFIFWRLRADPGQTQTADHDMGPFVDNVTVAWDDGQRDIKTTAPVFYEIVDTTYQVLTQARIGDQIYAAFNVSTCSGGGLSRYPAFNVRAWLNDTLKVYDSTYTGIEPASSLPIVTIPWTIVSADSHYLKIYVDSANVVVENNETNNRASNGFTVLPPNPPPTFVWLMAQDDTLEVTTDNLVLRWEAYDTQEQAHITLYYDADTLGCTASSIIGGTNRPERDGPDSLFWNIRLMALNTPYYLLARVSDADTTLCIHTAFPFVKHQNPSTVDRPLDGVIPDRFLPRAELPESVQSADGTAVRIGEGGACDVTGV